MKLEWPIQIVRVLQFSIRLMSAGREEILNRKILIQWRVHNLTYLLNANRHLKLISNVPNRKRLHHKCKRHKRSWRKYNRIYQKLHKYKFQPHLKRIQILKIKKPRNNLFIDLRDKAMNIWNNAKVTKMYNNFSYWLSKIFTNNVSNHSMLSIQKNLLTLR